MLVDVGEGAIVMGRACGIWWGGEHFFDASFRGGEAFFHGHKGGAKHFFMVIEGGRRDFFSKNY